MGPFPLSLTLSHLVQTLLTLYSLLQEPPCCYPSFTKLLLSPLHPLSHQFDLPKVVFIMLVPCSGRDWLPVVTIKSIYLHMMLNPLTIHTYLLVYLNINVFI